MPYKRICCLLLYIMLICLQIPPVHAEPSEASAVEEEPISVSISIRESAEAQYLVQPLTLSCPGGTTAAGLFPILEKFAYLAGYQLTESTLLAITLEENGETELIGGNGEWRLRINGVDIEANNLPLLSDGDVLEWIYHTEEEEGDFPDPEEPLPEVSAGNTAALWTQECADALSGACSWLRSNGEDNARFIGLGAAGVSVDYREIDALIQSIARRQTTYENAGAVSVDILAATFCGIYAGNVSGVNLLTTLSNYPDITRGGSYGAMLALLAADSNGYSLLADGINTRSTLRTVILSVQNDNGGFGLTREADSSPFLTACALTALARYSGYDEIREAVQAGAAYLSAIQMENGSYPGTDGFSPAQTTAAVLTALCACGISPDSAEFTKTGGNPLDALLAYRTGDGGFAAEIDSDPDETATLQAVLALVAVKGSRSSYVLRTAIQGQDASPSQAPEEESSHTSEVSSQPPAEEVLQPEKILFGGVGLTIGIVLGGLVLVIVLLVMRQKNKAAHRKSGAEKEGPPHG